MKHILAIIVKFIMVSVILEFVLTFMTALTFTQILTISLTVTVLSYVIGDLVMVHFSNWIATAIDLCVVIITIYLFNSRYGFAAIKFNAAFVSAVIFCVGEWFFHKYLAKSVLPQHEKEI